MVQADWGAEFGADNPKRLPPFSNGTSPRLGRDSSGLPWGRRIEYNGRVERSYRTDNKKFYIPFPGEVLTRRGILEGGGMSLLLQPGPPPCEKGMEGKSPFPMLQELRCALPQEFVVLPPLILDRISTDWALSMILRLATMS